MSKIFNPLAFVKSKASQAYSAAMQEFRDYSQLISFCVNTTPFDVTGYIDADDIA